MVNFKDEKEEKPTMDLFNTELEKLDASLENEQTILAKVNGTTDRSDNSVMLGLHVGETRKLIVATREQLALCQMYRERMK